MRRLIITTAFTLILLTAAAQGAGGKHGGGFDAERFQADLEQFIVREAGLTPSEAEVFFPVYREYNDKQHALLREKRFLSGYRPKTDEECREAIEKDDKYEIELKELQEQYHKKYLRLLPATKVYDIIRAEERFHRQSYRDMSRGKR